MDSKFILTLSGIKKKIFKNKGGHLSTVLLYSRNHCIRNKILSKEVMLSYK